MTIDLKGTALVITAICGGIAAIVGPIVTAYLQLRAARDARTNKTEAIAARANLESKVDLMNTAVTAHGSDIAAIKDAVVTQPSQGIT